MTDIPEDILAAAREVAREYSVGWLAIPISQALLSERMKERERCAKAVEQWEDDAAVYIEEHNAARGIASAIRSVE